MIGRMSEVKAEVSDDRLVGWLVMAASQWANECAFVLPPLVIQALIARGWMQQELKEPGHPAGDEYVAAVFTNDGMQVVAARAAEWGVYAD